MQDHIEEKFADSEIIIMAAAVADYCVEEVASQKIKKSAKTLTITLKKNPDILLNRRKQKINFSSALQQKHKNYLLLPRKNWNVKILI